MDGASSPHVDPRDEWVHPARAEPMWSESWYFDFVAPASGPAGFLRLAVAPDGTRSWWTYLVLPDGRVVGVRDEQLGAAGGARPADVWRIACEGLAVSVGCEDPLETWTVHGRAERGAVAGQGDEVPVSFSLRFEAAASPFRYPYGEPSRYEQPCRVRGEVTVGNDTFGVDGHGERDHSWGVRDWWRFPWTWTAGLLADDTFFHAAGSVLRGRVLWSAGFVAAPPAAPVAIDVFAEGRPAGRLEAAADRAARLPSSTLTVGQLSIVVVPGPYVALAMVSSEGRQGTLVRALCQFSAGDLSGSGWCEWNVPRVPALRRLPE